MRGREREEERDLSKCYTAGFEDLEEGIMNQGTQVASGNRTKLGSILQKDTLQTPGFQPCETISDF